MQKHFITADLVVGKVISELVFCFFPRTCLENHYKKKQNQVGLDDL